MFRTKSFDKLLSDKLKNPKVARGYIIEAISGDDPQSLVDALLDLIETMGHKEFSELVDMNASAITRMVKNGDMPKIEMINRFLAPFGLKTKLDVEEVA